MNLGFSTNVVYKNFDAAVSIYGAFGHYFITIQLTHLQGAFNSGRMCQLT
jgi:iron complex outermembrane receptor protein